MVKAFQRVNNSFERRLIPDGGQKKEKKRILNPHTAKGKNAKAFGSSVNWHFLRARGAIRQNFHHHQVRALDDDCTISVGEKPEKHTQTIPMDELFKSRSSKMLSCIVYNIQKIFSHSQSINYTSHGYRV